MAGLAASPCLPGAKARSSGTSGCWLPLAFLSPRIVSGLLDGTAPAGLTITALARALPWSWAEQERRLGLHCD